MKVKLSMLIATLLLATTTLFAQNFQRQTVPERVKSTMDKITGPLSLNASQVSSTDSVFTEFYTAQNKMREDARASGSRPDRSVFEKLASDRDEKLKAIFTDAQYTKFKNEVEPTLRPQRQGGVNN